MEEYKSKVLDEENVFKLVDIDEVTNFMRGNIPGLYKEHGCIVDSGAYRHETDGKRNQYFVKVAELTEDNDIDKYHTYYFDSSKVFELIADHFESNCVGKENKKLSTLWTSHIKSVQEDLEENQ